MDSFSKTLDVIGILKGLPLLRKHDLELIKSKLTEETFKDTPIIKEGEPGDKFYIIAEGVVSVIKGGSQLATLTTGDYFGEAALLSNAPRGATVSATNTVKVLSLDREQFNKLLNAGNSKVRFAKRNAVSAEHGGAKTFKSSMPVGATKEKDDATRDRILAAVKYNVLFMNLGREHQLALINEMYKTSVKQGVDVIVQGEAGDNLYVVDEGEFHVFVNNTRVAIRGKGTCFGELALMYNSPRAATVRASQDAEVWVVDRFTFKRVITDLSSKAMETYISFLNQVELLAPLSQSERNKIAEALEENNVLAGQEVIVEGHEGDAMYVVLEGQVSFYKAGQKVGQCSTGGYFGERALINNAPRAATVKADMDCKLLRLDRTAFSLLLGPLEEIMKAQIKTQDQDEKDGVVSGVTPSSSGATEAKSDQPVRSLDTNFDVAFNDLKVMAVLGKGSFGTVQLVTDPSGQQTYALKQISKTQIVQTGQQSHIMNEKNAMVQLVHPFLVRLFTTYKDKDCLYFLLEPVMGGELFSLLRDKTLFDEKDTKFYAANVIAAFEFMHEHNFVYRDLKPENLLLDAQGYLKITDFGFAKNVGDELTYTLCGTPDYLAPEIVGSKGHGKGVDWWTCGIFIYEMLASYTPFADDDPMKTYAKILHGSIVYPSHFSKEAVSIIKKLLHPKSTKRLGVVKGGAKLIKKHPWYKGFSWEDLLAKKLPAPFIPKISSPTDCTNFDDYGDEEDDEIIPYTDDGTGWDDGF
mmetsp:Transcript_22269/g.44181  ORF Transcript_22269/g.44181 Transcript_22269/m.44181 type:complete len:750 (-) Transcript_22269:1338-3587(-)|eukprot:CAMPEP_0175129798 /NCGR_PEP_ID=MMETSP0087-20121206/5665_1 /TAXON_ID=136419 /ORGANISM="Unknown Unknown, Strain D1" /LENGTH=749 /DNA_ID=CAMNT_0016411973 /DNA_START=46 /DNA_END=2295 /DNA_ORIENTATION=+